jgi:hypothetical protein
MDGLNQLTIPVTSLIAPKGIFKLVGNTSVECPEFVNPAWQENLIKKPAHPIKML